MGEELRATLNAESRRLGSAETSALPRTENNPTINIFRFLPVFCCSGKGTDLPSFPELLLACLINTSCT